MASTVSGKMVGWEVGQSTPGFCQQWWASKKEIIIERADILMNKIIQLVARFFKAFTLLSYELHDKCNIHAV